MTLHIWKYFVEIIIFLIVFVISYVYLGFMYNEKCVFIFLMYVYGIVLYGI